MRLRIGVGLGVVIIAAVALLAGPLSRGDRLSDILTGQTPLFGGNRDLAGRVYKTLFVGLGSGMLSLATPALVTGLIGRLRALFTRIEAKGAIADAILRDRALDQAQTAGFVLMALFAIAGVIAAVLVWTGQLWPGER